MAFSTFEKSNQFNTHNMWNDDSKQYERVATIYCTGCTNRDHIPIVKQAGKMPHNVLQRKFRQRGWALGKNRRGDLCPECQKRNAERGTKNQSKETVESVFGALREKTPRELAQERTRQLRKERQRELAETSVPTIEADLPEAGFDLISTLLREITEIREHKEKCRKIAERMLDEVVDYDQSIDVLVAKALDLILALPTERKDQMPFELILGTNRKSPYDGRVVRLSISKQGKTNCGNITISNEVLAKELGWTVGKTTCALHLGTEEDEGRLLIIPGHGARCKLQPVSPGSIHGHLKLPAPFGEYDKMAPTDIEFEIHREGLKKGPYGLIVVFPKAMKPAAKPSGLSGPVMAAAQEQKAANAN